MNNHTKQLLGATNLDGKNYGFLTALLKETTTAQYSAANTDPLNKARMALILDIRTRMMVMRGETPENNVTMAPGTLFAQGGMTADSIPENLNPAPKTDAELESMAAAGDDMAQKILNGRRSREADNAATAQRKRDAEIDQITTKKKQLFRRVKGYEAQASDLIAIHNEVTSEMQGA